jgi:hypothetical protein
MDTPERFCPSCREEDPPGSAPCNSCGATFNKNAPPTQPQPQSRPGWWRRLGGREEFVIIVLSMLVIGMIIGATQAGCGKTTTTTTPQSSTAEDSYKAAVVSIMTDVSAAVDAIAELVPLYPPWTDDQEAQFAAAVGTLQAMQGRLEELDPPPSFADTQEHLMSAAALYGSASTLTAEGIDEMDAAKLDDATLSFVQGGDQIDQATRDLPQ